jgi:inorganic pyrophosphatase
VGTKTKTSKARAALTFEVLSPFASKKTINVIIETPKGKRNKFDFDPKLGMFKLGKVLPAGAAFPYDFGFVPRTKAQDGDPIDVLLLMDESAYPGCLVEARLVGVIEAEQVEDGKTIRNDRLVAVAIEAHDYQDVKTIRDINTSLLEELEHFFKSYNESQGRQFRLLGSKGPQPALKLLNKTIKKRTSGASSRPRQAK